VHTCNIFGWCIFLLIVVTAYLNYVSLSPRYGMGLLGSMKISCELVVHIATNSSLLDFLPLYFIIMILLVGMGSNE